MRVRTFVSVTMAAMLLAILLPLLPFRAEAQPSHGGTITRVRPVVDGNVAIYDGTTGFFIEDGGVSLASLTNNTGYWAINVAGTIYNLSTNGVLVSGAMTITNAGEQTSLAIYSAATNLPAVRVVVPDVMVSNQKHILYEREDGTDLYSGDEDGDWFAKGSVRSGASGSAYSSLADGSILAVKGTPIYTWQDATAGEADFMASVNSDDWYLVSDEDGEVLRYNGGAYTWSFSSNALSFTERDEPADPADGNCVLWFSNGTGAGSDGDLVFKKTVGGTTTTNTINMTGI